MYPKFIEVHQQGKRISLNVENISVLVDDEDGTYKGAIQIRALDRTIGIDESYDELKALIFDAGGIIQKADPRLDNKPLTLDDLKGMIGEPVWNSNTRKWELVWYCDDRWVHTRDCGADFEYDEEDLLAKPLYRMKVAE